MAKYIKPTITEGILFALELYKRIPIGRKVTAAELKDELEQIGIVRDIRTIQRNLEVIVRYFDIEKDSRDKPYGYRKRSSAKRTLGAKEAILLLLVEEQLKAIMPKEVLGGIESTFIEARIQYSPVGQENWGSEPKKVVVVSGEKIQPKSTFNGAVFEKLCIALYHNRWMTIQIDSHPTLGKSKPTAEPLTYEVMPLGLALIGEAMHVVYQDKHSQAIVSTQLSSLCHVHVSTYRFDYPEGFELARFIHSEHLLNHTSRPLETPNPISFNQNH